MSHCGTASNDGVESARNEGVSEIPELDPAILEGDCQGLRSPLDDPSVRERIRERGLDLDRVLARATGEFRSTLRWPASGGKVSVAPESGDVPLTIRVSRAGAASYVDAVNDAVPPGAEVPGCPDHVEVEVSVEVRTDGGALNERFDAILAMNHRIGEIRYRAPLRSLRGSLSLSPPRAEGRRETVLGPELDYSMQVSELGTSGRLSVIVREFTDGVDTTEIPVDSTPLLPFAAWPAVADCPARQVVAPLDRGIDGLSPLRISEWVAAQAVPFTWADGTETTLIVSPRPTAGASCAFEAGDLIHRSFDADVSAVTADGILDGPLSGAMRLVQGPDRVITIFEMSRSSSKDALNGLLHTPAVAANDYSGFLEFEMTHSFAWPSEQPIGSEGGISIVVAPPPACDSEECDVRYTLAEGRVPATAAPPQ